MYKDINHQIEEAQQGIFRKEKINAMLDSLQKEKSVLVIKTEDLKDALEKEDQDVLKLESKSLAHIFNAVLGRLDDKLEKERQEALAAKLKYDQANSELEQINEEIRKLKDEKKRYRDCANTYEQLFQQKREMLIQSNAEVADQLLRLSTEVQKSKNNLKEIHEAIQAGENAMHYIMLTLENLNKASGLGTWDMLGGGLFVDLAKHSRIDEAKSMAEKVQMYLLKFKTELTDVRISGDIHFEMNGFSKFADFFFDGIIADWAMQSKIHASEDSVRNVQSQVQTVLAKLKNMEQMENSKLQKTEQEMEWLVTKS